MGNKNRLRLAGLVATGVLAAFLSGCGGGDTGATGATGEPGTQGPTGPAGPAGPAGSSVLRVAANTATATDATIAAWKTLDPVVTVTGVTVASPPVVDFKVTTVDGAPVVGLGSQSTGDGRGATFAAGVKQYPNLAFSIAKLVPGTDGAPSKWVSYIVTTVPTTAATTAAPTRPSTDNTGTLVDNGDGSYKYTFHRDITKIKDEVAAMSVAGTNNKADLGDLTYDAALTHRVTIQLSGNAPGTGTNTPTGTQTVAGVPLPKAFDAIYDFVPSTGQAVATSGRDIVANAKCEECHRKLGGIPGDSAGSSGALFHGGSRNEVRYCVVCHTEQRKYGRAEVTYNASTLTVSGSAYKMDDRAIGNLPNFIHKIHAGHSLAKQGYDYAGVAFNHVGYPQDVRNCTKCHDGGTDKTKNQTAQGDNWKTKPSALACGSCHDGINFKTGTGVTLADANKGLTSTSNAHPAGPLPDDSMCSTCHKSDGSYPLADVDLAHLPVTPPSLASALHVAGGSANTNSAWIASNTSRLPPGAIKVSYDVKAVTRNASKQPVIEFRMLQDGVAKNLNDFATTAVNSLTGDKEIWDNFMGSPSVYFVFAVPQDGIAAPADFNASASGYLKNIWKGTATGTGAGTISAPDANGYIKVTLTGVTIPDNAVMLTGGIGYSYNVSSTLPLTQTNLADYPVSVSPAGAANEIGGLIVIAPNVQKVATGYTARRAIVEDKRCNACHQELGTFTEEAFHGGQRNDGTSCAWCHTPNRANGGWSVDSTAFVHAIHGSAKRTVKYSYYAVSATEGFWDIGYPGVLKDCEACHLPGTSDFSATASAAALPNRLFRTTATGTYASTGTTYRYSPYITQDLSYGSGFSFNAGTGATTAAAGTTLVTSPISTACFSCHDAASDKAHMEQFGGTLYNTRAIGLATTETCTICHGPGSTFDIGVMHKK